ncbi:hypothetical protein [Arcticibacter sp. MXS-1]|uniref:hypothetical protein n=1 Tax=Arcticibacter sp. MXS-1 TaxID=3341726 RepID=UPI0035A99D9C
MAEEKKIIPEQEEGIQTDTESSVSLESREAALKHYQVVRERLLNVKNWRQVSKVIPSDFKLIDSAGKEVSRPVEEGDYFKIDIPGPGSDSGEGNDWVRVHRIEETGNSTTDDESIAIHVIPSANPQNASTEVSHFFDDKASSTFVVRREGTKIFASVHGRNENPNTETENLADKVRNAFVAIGAMLGFSKAQWKSLVEGLVEKD